MVDFRKRLGIKQIEKKINPVEIYDSLDRRSVTGPLRPAQEDVLTTWFNSRRNDRDLIVKLHTGEGKTLIGLLILQSKINSGDGPCIFICPNIYLADKHALKLRNSVYHSASLKLTIQYLMIFQMAIKFSLLIFRKSLMDSLFLG